ncbi:MAG TPA: DUF1080 domain-containing protein [Chthonomonadales bacterium]|nr:DUF1080 domain-containing protein [Chthonomonadales bacterium]
MYFVRLVLALMAAAVIAAPVRAERGFVRLFDGRSLAGWTLEGGVGPGYVVRNGELVCPSDGGGVLFTEREYSDFVLRFDFRLDRAGNNGVAIRAPREGRLAYDGMEVQILDDSDPAYAGLEPGQYSGSIYRVAPARRGALRPVGQWNRKEITAIGRRVAVRVNGRTVVDVDLNTVTDARVLAENPGILRDRGRIGLMGHGPATVSFRNIRVRDLTRPHRDNTPPPGFTALFDGRTLRGWKGLVGNPITRAAMSPEALRAAEEAATVRALQHWTVVDGAITYDGRNDSLCTARDFRDFELLVDWRTPPGGDSGIYLRGSPQIQIWDHAAGSGGLYNNQRNPSAPTMRADNPPGEWNRFRILMLGEKVTVWLNGRLVVHNVTMENFWDRTIPIFPTGQIELQHHGSQLWFKNIYIREIGPPAPQRSAAEPARAG